jgi:hypothetical protein
MRARSPADSWAELSEWRLCVERKARGGSSGSCTRWVRQGAEGGDEASDPVGSWMRKVVPAPVTVVKVMVPP